MSNSHDQDDTAFSETPQGRGGVRLIRCDACSGTISEAAEACPHCGHPNKPAPREPAGPRCYACSAAATTRCQSCGALSCATHLQSIYVHHGKGGAYELRCESCYSDAQSWATLRWVVGIIGLIVAAIFFFGYFLPKWNEADRGFEENRKWINEGKTNAWKDK